MPCRHKIEVTTHLLEAAEEGTTDTTFQTREGIKKEQEQKIS